MTPTALSPALAVLAAVANATSSTLQRKANMSESDGRSFKLRLVLDLIRRPIWLGGIAAVTGGFLLQAAALAQGQLALVEPLLVLELPFTLGLAGLIFGRRLHRHEWGAAAMLSAGLALLVVGLGPRGGTALRVPVLHWAVGAATTLAVVGALVARAVRCRARRASLLGVATGATFGMTAAFMTAASGAFSRHGASALGDWQTWAMVISGLAGMYLLQNALQAGSLVAVQPGVTLADPPVAILWGVLVFGEHVHGGAWLLGDLAGAGLIAWGTFRLSRSPLVHAPSPEGVSGPG